MICYDYILIAIRFIDALFRIQSDTPWLYVVVLFDATIWHASPDWGWVCSETRTAGPIHL
jgi:hypothetical protein